MVICRKYMFKFIFSKDMKKQCCRLWQMRDQQVGRWGSIPKIASLVKPIMHRKGGGSREDSDTLKL